MFDDNCQLNIKIDDLKSNLVTKISKSKTVKVVLVPINASHCIC